MLRTPSCMEDPDHALLKKGFGSCPAVSKFGPDILARRCQSWSQSSSGLCNSGLANVFKYTYFGWYISTVFYGCSTGFLRVFYAFLWMFFRGPFRKIRVLAYTIWVFTMLGKLENMDATYIYGCSSISITFYGCFYYYIYGRSKLLSDIYGCLVPASIRNMDVWGYMQKTSSKENMGDLVL